jgi:hypothetical protein
MSFRFTLPDTGRQKDKILAHVSFITTKKQVIN